MIRINIPDSVWSTNRVSLQSSLYTMNFRFNSRDKRWRMDIYRQGEPVVLGLKLMENQLLMYRYVLENWAGGDFLPMRFKDDGKDIVRDNLGFNKAYELIFFTEEEIDNI